MTWKDWIQPGIVVAVVLGMGGWQIASVAGLREAVAELRENLHTIDVRLAVVETRLDGMDRRLGTIEARQAGMDRRLGTIEARQADMDRRLGTIEARQAGMDRRLETIEARQALVLAGAANTGERREVDEQTPGPSSAMGTFPSANDAFASE